LSASFLFTSASLFLLRSQLPALLCRLGAARARTYRRRGGRVCTEEVRTLAARTSALRLRDQGKREEQKEARRHKLEHYPTFSTLTGGTARIRLDLNWPSTHCSPLTPLFPSRQALAELQRRCDEMAAKEQQWRQEQEALAHAERQRRAAAEARAAEAHKAAERSRLSTGWGHCSISNTRNSSW